MKPATMLLHTFIVLSVALAALASPCALRADVVTDWNQITLATQASIPGGIRTPPAARALAMVHLAIFDSINAIDRRFTPYLIDSLADPSASPEAAAVAAAHAVLVALYPSRAADLDQAYANSLTAIPDGQAKDEGIALGAAVAAVLLALRSGDGSAVTLPYTVPPGPGIYQPDPVALFVAWGNVTPFTLKSGSQFRAQGPPALSSAKYAADYLEVQSVGALNSLTRTPDQTEAALFWVENIQISFNNIARIVAVDQQNSLTDNARLFALLNLAGVDTTIVVMDTKYTFNFWRPREAIRAGDTDGNARTTAEPTWTPLTYIGVHPDYVSQHSAYGQAAATVLARFFGTDDITFSITTSTAPGGVFRSYQSFSQAAVENMNSRVWLGAHFRTACRHGIKQGKQVAHYVMNHFLRPLHKTH
ncbi:MAG: phosphatase PAP2 family protein [Deltaproteobacteria bacterium]|nr:phosphatase PAP2 family protein [Deltaproteobacteria bacterium]